MNNNSVHYSEMCAFTVIIRRVCECFSSFRIYVRQPNLRIVYECVSVRVALTRSRSLETFHIGACCCRCRSRSAISNFWLTSSTFNVSNGSRTFPIRKLLFLFYCMRQFCVIFAAVYWDLSEIYDNERKLSIAIIFLLSVLLYCMKYI